MKVILFTKPKETLYSKQLWGKYGIFLKCAFRLQYYYSICGGKNLKVKSSKEIECEKFEENLIFVSY